MPDFPTTALIIFLSVLHGRTARMGALPMVLIRLPSTFFHEFEHLAAAFATLAQPDAISIFPRKGPEGWVLGSVQCKRIGMLNAFPVAMAPALIGVPLAYWAFNWHTLGGYVLTFLLLTAAVPSWTDFEVAFSSFVGALMWMAAGVCFWIFGGGLIF